MAAAAEMQRLVVAQGLLGVQDQLGGPGAGRGAARWVVHCNLQVQALVQLACWPGFCGIHGTSYHGSIKTIRWLASAVWDHARRAPPLADEGGAS